MGRGFLVIVLSCLIIACDDGDLEFGTSKKDGLRIGMGSRLSVEVTLQDVDVNFNFSTPSAGITKVRSEANIIVRQE